MSEEKPDEVKEEEVKTETVETPPEPGRPATPEEAEEVEPVAGETSDEEPTEAPTDAPPPPPQPQAAVRIAKMAQIEWLDEEGNSKEEPDKEECWRSLANIFVTLGHMAEEKTRELTERVRVTLMIMGEDNKPSTITNSKGEERSEIVLFDDGTLQEALEHFAKVAMPPQVAYAKLQGAIGQISEMSTLKAAIITLVFDDAKPAGMVFMSDAVDVTENDLTIAGTSGEHFVEQYKSAMRKDHGIQFPGDSNIIIPGQGDMPPGFRI